MTTARSYQIDEDAQARVLAKVAPADERGCRLWMGGLDKRGYGEFSLRRPGTRSNDKYRAHRLVYTILRGPVDGTLDLDHLCRVHACVNPDHLEPVTRRTNVLRGANRVAAHAAQDACVNGHPYTSESTYRYGPNNRWRRCKICDFDRQHANASGLKCGATASTTGLPCKRGVSSPGERCARHARLAKLVFVDPEVA